MKSADSGVRLSAFQVLPCHLQSGWNQANYLTFVCLYPQNEAYYRISARIKFVNTGQSVSNYVAQTKSLINVQYFYCHESFLI